MGKFAFAAAAAAIVLVPAAAAAHPEAGHSWVEDRSYPEAAYGHPRLRPGDRVHPMLLQPRYHVREGHVYGLYRPAPGHRWVRFYDDSYLVDEAGWIRDARYGVDWQAETWAHEDRIPLYAEDNPPPEVREHRWSERHPYPPHGYAMPAPPAYHHAPQGWYGAPFLTIVETTVTPVTTYVEIVEEEIVEQPRAVRKPPVRRSPPPPPPPPPARTGERG